MDSYIKSSCGCKGIRTCLICEAEKGNLINAPQDTKAAVYYSYCLHCNLCWPVDGTKSPPLFLGKLLVILDFLTEEEETDIITAIDKIEWVPSQSGRKKQDFGPKVNFKKKKIQTGNFKGFPTFSKDVIHKLQQYKDMSDFQPVELCHLDYTPERGSAIDPHIDDAWIWGERLVTINLASDTILTLSPANLAFCECRTQLTELPNFKLQCSHNLLTNEHQATDACSIYRLPSSDMKLEIGILLPRRSLFLLAGCSRHNWFHEIKRKDVISRRLAMTFRELSENFQEGGKEEKFGNELLTIGKTFCKFEAIC